MVLLAVPFTQIELLHRIALPSAIKDMTPACPDIDELPSEEVGLIAVLKIDTAEEEVDGETVALRHRLRLSSIQLSRTKAKVPIFDPWKPWTYLIAGDGPPTVDIKITIQLSNNRAPADDDPELVTHSFDFILTELELPAQGKVISMSRLDTGFPTQETDWFSFPAMKQITKSPEKSDGDLNSYGELNIQATVIESNKFGEVVKKTLMEGQERKEETVKKIIDYIPGSPGEEG
tara:strand:- start:5387 stop:6085 length:699 start_codon:yes stop_codon:yes gene_type:complete